ncbi:hypothetical protein CEXT_311451 [Caerostris extrusa]|uniref:Uncharacterized protein n=1 Tax=Caerostris extrusa TaxID=172846 RepID=A0AAV4MZS7_CAEEX|nr:hypothetical protein CEXT_311451 [Caerostris extrusa]
MEEASCKWSRIWRLKGTPFSLRWNYQKTTSSITILRYGAIGCLHLKLTESGIMESAQIDDFVSHINRADSRPNCYLSNAHKHS